MVSARWKTTTEKALRITGDFSGDMKKKSLFSRLADHFLISYSSWIRFAWQQFPCLETRCANHCRGYCFFFTGFDKSTLSHRKASGCLQWRKCSQLPPWVGANTGSVLGGHRADRSPWGPCGCSAGGSWCRRCRGGGSSLSAFWRRCNGGK